MNIWLVLASPRATVIWLLGEAEAPGDALGKEAIVLNPLREVDFEPPPHAGIEMSAPTTMTNSVLCISGLP
ncbi:MAG TPA: hypothetical protein VEQ37_18345 [Actinomycetota bacterium]|nr:hypothetical protein [Actinomycetota bacterium]